MAVHGIAERYLMEMRDVFRSPRITRIDANQMAEIIYKSESYAIIGACFEVYNEKGCGFLEPVYQESLGIEFEYQHIPAIGKPSLTLSYRGRILKQTYERITSASGKLSSSSKRFLY